MNAFNIFIRHCERSEAIRRLVGVLAVVLVGVGGAWAQPDSLWSRTFGGWNDDWCHSLIQTTDGGFALAGETNSFGAGGYDFWLVRTNADGDSLWSRTFGGWNDEWNDDWCSSLIQTADGGFALAGYTGSTEDGGGVWLVRTNAQGDSLWSRTFGDGFGCNSLIQTVDGGFALAGYTLPLAGQLVDFWLVRTDADGDSLWSRTFGGARDDECRSIIQTADGGFALGGETASFGAGSSDLWLVRTDGDGDSLWSRTFGGGEYDGCNSLIQTADGDFALAGWTRSVGAGELDFLLVQTNALGDSLLSRTFGGGMYDYCHSLIQAADGGFALAGETNSFGAGGYDFWLVRTNAQGDSLWSRTFNGGEEEKCFSLIQTTDHGFALAGWTGSFDAGDKDFWLVKTGPDPLTVSDPSVHPSSFILSAPFPNPFNARTTVNYTLSRAGAVRLGVYDPLGRLVGNIPSPGWETAGNHSVNWNAEGMAAGSYFLRLEAGGETRQKEMILLK